MTSINAVCVFDITLKVDETNEDHKVVIATLKGWCKKWAFQRELSDSGLDHYQGRVSLIKKRRLQELIPLWHALPPFRNIHLSVSSTNGASEEFYVLKDDTRVAGPFTDRDLPPPYIPRQVRECKSLRPFQQEIIDHAKDWDTRHINLVYCPTGNCGKSTLCSYIRAHGIGRVIPPFTDYQDFSACVLDQPESTLYIVDMPRAMKKDKLQGLYTAIETCKDGFVFDKRYKYRERIFDCPNMWVFSNRMPDLDLLSQDRWKIWTINSSYELVPDVPES